MKQLFSVLFFISLQTQSAELNRLGASFNVLRDVREVCSESDEDGLACKFQALLLESSSISQRDCTNIPFRKDSCGKKIDDEKAMEKKIKVFVKDFIAPNTSEEAQKLQKILQLPIQNPDKTAQADADDDAA